MLKNLNMALVWYFDVMSGKMQLMEICTMFVCVLLPLHHM